MKRITSDRDLIDYFLDSYESPGTRATYRRQISHYQSFLDSEGIGLKDSTPESVQNFINERKSVLNEASLKLQMATLKGLYKFGVQSQYLNSNIMSAFKLSKSYIFKAKNELVSDHDVLKLLDHIDRGTLKGARQHALVCLTYYSFLKITEALNIRICDIQEIDMRHVARVYSRSKERMVPIPREAMKSLKEYIDILPSSVTSESKIFVRTEQKGSAFVVNKPFTGSQANTQLRNYRRSADLSENISFETIRQAGLRRYVKSGVSLNQARFGPRLSRNLTSIARLAFSLIVTDSHNQ